jgi:Na/Pi-cotransporter
MLLDCATSKSSLFLLDMEIFGGIGLFLLGMMLLTEGLQAMASNTLARLLETMTQTRLRGVLLGTFITAVLQSSSAATLLTLGFVNSGILSFQNALGVVFGSNLGTTVTSWLISLVGLKISIKAFALPMIGVGALLKLLKTRFRHLGLGLCGFGLLFLGLDLLQSGMQQYSHLINLGYGSTDSLFGMIILVLIGMGMSVVMQSSSVAIATTLTALYGGAITFHAAIYLVIGQNIGTTVTALIGAIGASINAKRTAYAHLFFNVVAAGFAFLIVPFYLVIFEWWQVHMFVVDPTIGLSFFHTLSKVLGIAVCLPMAGVMASYLEKWITQDELNLSERLIRELSLKEITGPVVALDIFEKKMIELLGMLGKLDTKRQLQESSQELLNHYYLYIAQIKIEDQEEQSLVIRTELLRALENVRAILQLSIDSTVLGRADQLLSLSRIRSTIAELQDKMIRTHYDDAYELLPDEQKIEEDHITRLYQDYRIELLRKAQTTHLDHATLTQYLDAIKNLMAHHQYFSKIHGHLNELRNLRLGPLEVVEEDTSAEGPEKAGESPEESQTSLF